MSRKTLVTDTRCPMCHGSGEVPIHRQNAMRTRLLRSLERYGFETPEKAAAMERYEFFDQRSIGITAAYELMKYLTENDQPLPDWLRAIQEG